MALPKGEDATIPLSHICINNESVELSERGNFPIRGDHRQSLCSPGARMLPPLRSCAPACNVLAIHRLARHGLCHHPVCTRTLHIPQANHRLPHCSLFQPMLPLPGPKSEGSSLCLLPSCLLLLSPLDLVDLVDIKNKSNPCKLRKAIRIVVDLLVHSPSEWLRAYWRRHDVRVVSGKCTSERLVIHPKSPNIWHQ